MALVQVVTNVVLRFRDRENTIATTGFFLNPPGLASVDADALYQKAQAAAAAVAAMSDCQLVGMKVTFQDRDDTAVGAGEVERKGEFDFAVAGGTNYRTFVPGFKDALLEANQRTIAVLGSGVTPQVQAFIDAVLNGPASFSNGATNAAGINLARVVSGRKLHVSSLKESRGRSG